MTSRRRALRPAAVGIGLATMLAGSGLLTSAPAAAADAVLGVSVVSVTSSQIQFSVCLTEGDALPARLNAYYTVSTGGREVARVDWSPEDPSTVLLGTEPCPTEMVTLAANDLALSTPYTIAVFVDLVQKVADEDDEYVDTTPPSTIRLTASLTASTTNGISPDDGSGSTETGDGGSGSAGGSSGATLGSGGATGGGNGGGGNGGAAGAPVVITDSVGFTVAQLIALTPAQVATIPGATFGQLPPATFRGLSALQAAAITPDQASSIRPARAAELKPTAVAALSPAALTAMRPSAIKFLSPEAVRAMTPVQLSALTSRQLTALRPKQLAELSPAQRALLRR